MFSAAFSSAFAGVVSGRYIGPALAQAALAAGAEFVVRGSALLIDGAALIGPAGKVYAFRSADTAATWAENAAAVVVREAQIIAGLPAEKAAAWKVKKRARLAMVAGRLCDAAARQGNEGKRAALLADSDYLLGKWA